MFRNIANKVSVFVAAGVTVFVFGKAADIFTFNFFVRVALNLIVLMLFLGADEPFFSCTFCKASFIMIMAQDLNFSAGKFFARIAFSGVAVKNNFLFFADKFTFGLFAVLGMSMTFAFLKSAGQLSVFVIAVIIMLMTFAFLKGTDV